MCCAGFQMAGHDARKAENWKLGKNTGASLTQKPGRVSHSPISSCIGPSLFRRLPKTLGLKTRIASLDFSYPAR